MSEPTSVLTFNDLILEVAIKLAMAYYGANGDEAAQIPVDAHDLAECKRLVNNGIRMFLNDGPEPAGWRFAKPIGSFVLWPSVAVDATNPLTGAAYDGPTDTTTITVGDDSFYETMEYKTITFTGVGAFTITDYVSATSVKVSGDASAANGATWSIDADGSYTLPETFGGEYLGDITFAADTNKGSLTWGSEAGIRAWQENSNQSTGTPFVAAVRTKSSGSPRRRWELLVYPTPSEAFTVEFPYTLHFDKLTASTDVPPIPFLHDETVKAACRAYAEKDGNDGPGPDWAYYQDRCLPASYRHDRLSAPRRLGYCGNAGRSALSIREFRDRQYQRPTVTFNS